MTASELRSFESCPTRVDLDCMALRRRTRLNRARTFAVRSFLSLYVIGSLVAIASACIR